MTCRVELSLRSTAPKAMIGLEDLKEGQTVTGRVKRVEAYGAFISLAGSGLTGLCHISEVADERVADLPSMLQPGQGGRCLELQSFCRTPAALSQPQAHEADAWHLH